jgi:hypothetical protein
MTTRTFVDKNGNTWEWEETPELIEILNQLHAKKDNDGKESN